jgi:hypothetical protein
MSTLPGPLRAALGVVATVLDEARALPEKAPELPMTALTTALQYSLRAQQRYADLMVRGDELVGRIRGVPDEAPAWAKFDDDPATEYDAGSASVSADPPGEFTTPPAPPAPPVKAPSTNPGAKQASSAAPAKKVSAKKATAKSVPVKKAAAKSVPVKKTAAKNVPARQVPAKQVPAKNVPAKTIPAKRTSPATRSGPRLSAFDRVDESAIDDGFVPPID